MKINFQIDLRVSYVYARRFEGICGRETTGLTLDMQLTPNSPIPCFHNNTLGVRHDGLCHPEALKLNCDQSEAPLVCLKMEQE